MEINEFEKKSLNVMVQVNWNPNIQLQDKKKNGSATKLAQNINYWYKYRSTLKIEIHFRKIRLTYLVYGDNIS